MECGKKRVDIGAARTQGGAIAQAKYRIPIGTGLELGHLVHADDGRTMHALESGRIELARQHRQGLAQEVALPLGMQGGVIAIGLDPRDIRRLHEAEACPDADTEALRPMIRDRPAELPPRAFDRFGQTLVVDRFEQVIDGVEFEGSQGEAVVRGEQDRERPFRGRNRRQCVESAQTRHLHVDECDVHGIVAQGRQTVAVAAFGNYRHIRLGTQTRENTDARQRLVVDHGHANHSTSFTGEDNRQGNATVTRHCAPTGPASNSWTPGWSAWRRARTFVSPTPWPSLWTSSILSFSTSTRRISSSRCTRIDTVPPSPRGAMPWRIAFSTSGWSSRWGTSASSVSGPVWMSTRRRSPSRAFSISR